MDFTFLFIVVLMLLAVKSDMFWIAIALFVLLLFTSKSKYLFLAAIIGFAVVAATKYIDLGEYTMWVVVGGLFAVVLLISRKETIHPSPEAGAYGGG